MPNVRSDHYFIARRAIDCPYCGASTGILALALPPGHEVLEEHDEEGHCDWQAVPAHAVIFEVAQLPPGVQRHLVELAPGFRQPRNDFEGSQFNNYCEHCAERLDDQDLHCEPGDTFLPLTPEQGARIRLLEIPEPIEASASGYSLDPAFVPFGRHA